jgi:hypothetical protein
MYKNTFLLGHPLDSFYVQQILAANFFLSLNFGLLYAKEAAWQHGSNEISSKKFND